MSGWPLMHSFVVFCHDFLIRGYVCMGTLTTFSMLAFFLVLQIFSLELFTICTVSHHSSVFARSRQAVSLCNIRVDFQ